MIECTLCANESKYVQHSFLKWLSINSHRFYHSPCNIQQNDNSITFNLKGITETLQWVITEEDALFELHHKMPWDDENTFWEGFGWFYLTEEQSDNGQYYCSDCEEQYRQYYPTRLALWESHCFEAFLEWSNENLTSGKILVLYQWHKAMTAAEMFSLSEWELTKDENEGAFYKIIPIFKSPK